MEFFLKYSEFKILQHFLKENVNKISYLGSTRIEKYLLCLKLNDKVQFESNSLAKEDTFKLVLYIQAIDNLFDSLNALKDGSFDYQNDSIRTIELTINGLKPNNYDITNENHTFIDRVIYDLEFFNLN